MFINFVTFFILLIKRQYVYYCFHMLKDFVNLNIIIYTAYFYKIPKNPNQNY